LPGRSVTRLTAYHISRHVASTFKSLATTTTHFDLIVFIKTDRAKIPGHDTTHDPVHCPYSGCKIVNKQFLYRASDRKSLDFYRSYLAEHLIDRTLGAIHWFLGFMHLGFQAIPNNVMHKIHKDIYRLQYNKIVGYVRGLPSEAKLGSDELKTSERRFGASVTSSVAWTESSDSPVSGSKINS
jgi:hypothetical protein